MSKAVTADQFKKAIDGAGIESVKYWSGWKNEWRGMKWKGKNKNPQFLVLHHTAGASTSSTDPKHKGNQTSADEGQAKFVNRHPSFDPSLPASQFTLRRSGHLDVNTFNVCYHAGEGSFKGTEWSGHNVPDNAGNSYGLGIEIVSKGIEDDLCEAQWQTLAKLAVALKDLYGWKDTSTYFFPRHRDWAPKRKVDIKASNKRVQKKFDEYAGQWDGHTPDYDVLKKGDMDRTLASKAVWRLSCRLADIGYGGKNWKPELYSQTWPVKAMEQYNAKWAPDMEQPSTLGPKAFTRIFEEGK
jgi:N-acetyl-anhydromuramyl-L-alanine amidase AmpD